MDRQKKTRLTAYLSVFILITLLLSVSLSSFTPKPGVPLTSLQFPRETGLNGEDSALIKIPELILKIFLSLLFLALVSFIIRNIKKNKQGRDLVSVFFLTLGIAVVISTAFLIIPDETLSMGSDRAAPSAEAAEVPPGEGRPMPQGVLTILLWTAAIFMAGLTGAFVLILIFREESQEDILDLIEREAAATRDSIETGRDLRDTIVLCYHNMCGLLLKEQDVEREAHMTVGDFEERLNAIGIRSPAVHLLSGLFETVRYGKEEPGRKEGIRAIGYLDDIKDAIADLKRMKCHEKE